MCVYMCICRIHVCVGSRGSRTLSCSFNLSFLIIMQARPTHFPDRRDKTALDCSPVWQPPCPALAHPPTHGLGASGELSGLLQTPERAQVLDPTICWYLLQPPFQLGKALRSKSGEESRHPFSVLPSQCPPRARTGGHSGNQTWSIAALVLGVQKLETFPSGL